jgi:Major intrinsic protein
MTGIATSSGLFEAHTTVADLGRSVGFYRDVVGLEPAFETRDRCAAFLWAGGPGRSMLGLWVEHPRSASRSTWPSGRPSQTSWATATACGRLAQLAGALAAAAILRGSLGNIAHVGATFPSGSQAQSFLWELVMSAFLMFVILAVATDTRAVGEAAAIAIGGTIGLDAMFGGPIGLDAMFDGPISGASMNPTRSLAPGIVSGDRHAIWLFIVAPLLGASIGGLAYQFIRGESPAAGSATAGTRAAGGQARPASGGYARLQSGH